MNLIEKLGLEKCKQIVEGAPEGAQLFKTHFNLVGYAKLQTHFVYMATTTFKNGFSDKAVWKIMGCRSVLKFKPRRFKRLDNLRTAIANHEKCQHEWNETTSNGDAYRFFVCKHCDSTQNYVPFKDDNPSHFDHCSDIKNHISPLTRVIER